MPIYDFDKIVDRRAYNSGKWNRYPEDVIPMWVADTDFEAPPEIAEAIRRRMEHHTFGYTFQFDAMQEAVAERMKQRYNYEVLPEEVMFSATVNISLNVIAKSFGKDGDAILMQSPIYGPFRMAPANQGKFAYQVELQAVQDSDHTFHYEIDYDALQFAAMSPQSKMLFLCNPHNPGGFAYTREMLEKTVQICMDNDLIIVSDEIHAEVMLDRKQHIPTATLSPEIAQHTMTLLSPSKMFNTPGLQCAIMIVHNEEWRKQMAMTQFSMGYANMLGVEASLAAYLHGDEWQRQALAYMQANRDYALEYIQECFPHVKTTVPETTFLLWMDWRDVPIDENPYDFCLNEAKVALSPGNFFGDNTDGFVRLNYGCPRSILQEGLERIHKALERRLGS